MGTPTSCFAGSCSLCSGTVPTGTQNSQLAVIDSLALWNQVLNNIYVTQWGNIQWSLPPYNFPPGPVYFAMALQRTSFTGVAANDLKWQYLNSTQVAPPYLPSGSNLTFGTAGLNCMAYIDDSAAPSNRWVNVDCNTSAWGICQYGNSGLYNFFMNFMTKRLQMDEIFYPFRIRFFCFCILLQI